MNTPIPYLDLAAQLRPLRKEIDAAIAKTIDNCSFCLGPDVAQFEKDFATFCGTQQAVGFNSGTSALHVALRCLDIGPGDEVITTPHTFVATSWAISYVGASPVYVDIDDLTFYLDPKLVERAITPHTKAIMPVHLYGQPCDMDPLLDICKKHNLTLVEDAAQGHGAKYHGKNVGTFGRYGRFQLLSRQKSRAPAAKAARSSPMTLPWPPGPAPCANTAPASATTTTKSATITAWKASRAVSSESNSNTSPPGPRPAAASLIATTNSSPTPRCNSRVKPPILRAVITFTLSATRAAMNSRNTLKPTKSVAPCITLPLHLQKCYANLGYKQGDLPVAEKAARECLSLPIYPELTDNQLARVSEVIHDFFLK